MNVDVGVGTICGLYLALYFGGDGVCAEQTQVAIHADVYIDGIVAAYAAGAQVMRGADTFDGEDDAAYLLYGGAG